MSWDVARIGTTRKLRGCRIFTGKLLGESHLEKSPKKQEYEGNRDRSVGSEDRMQAELVCFLSGRDRCDTESGVILRNSLLC